MYERGFTIEVRQVRRFAAGGSTQVIDKPTSLTAREETNSVLVVWTPSITPSVTGYKLWLIDGDGVRTYVGGTTQHFFNFTGLTSDTEYTFEVVATAPHGDSDPVQLGDIVKSCGW